MNRNKFSSLLFAVCILTLASQSQAALLTISPPEQLVIDGEQVTGGQFTVFGLFGFDPTGDDDNSFQDLCPDCSSGNFPGHLADFSIASTPHTIADNLLDTALPISILLYSFDPDGDIPPLYNAVFTTSIEDLTILLPTQSDLAEPGNIGAFVELFPVELRDEIEDLGILWQVTDANGQTEYSNLPPFIGTVSDPDNPLLDPRIFDLGTGVTGEELIAQFFADANLYVGLGQAQDHGTTNAAPDDDDNGNNNDDDTNGGNGNGIDIGDGDTGNDGGGTPGGGNDGPTATVNEPGTIGLLMLSMALLAVRRKLKT
ncbi:MAG: hypothetical protein ACR2PZ_10145 [Pseudomonadales bacterium]